MGLNYDYIDGQTPLSEEEKEGLKIKSITTREELDEFEQQNIEKGIQWTLGKKFTTETLLTEKNITRLHQKMFSDVWRWAGKFRSSEKNLGVKSYLIPTELKKLLDDAIFWIEHNTFYPEKNAIIFKHRLVSIHCFANGNGRHSRLMADLIMEKIYNKPIFTWGGSNLSNKNDKRKMYIRSVKKADDNDYEPLLKFASL